MLPAGLGSACAGFSARILNSLINFLKENAETDGLHRAVDAAEQQVKQTVRLVKVLRTIFLFTQKM
jgi:hypothetical protein